MGEQVHAQAPINSNVALQPSEGGLIIRQQFRYAEGDFQSSMGDLDIQSVSSITTLVYGATKKVTLIVNAPLVLSRRIDNRTSGFDDTDSGFTDLSVLAKVRVYRNDFGPTDTTRFDLIGGLELPTGAGAFGSDSVDPVIGGVLTHIEGRHALDVDAVWKLNTAGGSRGADLLRYDFAYIYRLSPAVYASQKPTALFGLMELNGFYEANGDQELFLSPGIQYVTQRWVLEATLQVPIWQDLSQRAERDFIVGIGFRVQF